MTFISHAQNYEDVILWRALGFLETGLYVDVGAAWPDFHSVTKAFYDRGWHGINIEPRPDLFELLAKQRTRDINENMAMGDTQGVLTLHMVNQDGQPTGLSTLSEDIAIKHSKSGFETDTAGIAVTTLAELCGRRLPPGAEIHFLKVDAEGFEEAVLRGNDWTVFRPWIVVVEATEPLSQHEAHESWQDILIEADYRFAYADGLNIFYVANEHPELLAAFKYPPNIFDDFLPASQLATLDRAAQAESRIGELQDKLEKIRNSRSWRWTGWLRTIERLFGGRTGGGK